MERSTTPTAYLGEDGIVGHQWEERTLVLSSLYAPVPGTGRTWKWEWGGLFVGGGGGDRGFKEGKPGKGI